LITLVADYTRSKIIITGTEWVLMVDEMDHCPYESYNIETNTWTTLYGWQTHNGDRLCVLDDGFLYNISSYGNRKTNYFNQYTPDWTFLPSMPSGTRTSWGCAICVYNNHIYIFGGQTPPSAYDPKGTEYFSSAYCFDPQTSIWESLGDMCFPRGQPAACSCNDVIVISGGLPHPETCEIFNPKTRLFTPFVSLNEKRHAHSMTAWGHLVFVFGTRTLSLTYEKIDLKELDKKWIAVPFGGDQILSKNILGIPMTAKLAGWTAVTVDDYIYISGLIGCCRLDPVTLKVTTIAPMYYQRGGYGAFAACVAEGE